jgi:hypothetical protein
VVTGVVLTVLHDLAVESLTDAARPWWQRAWRRMGRLLGMGRPKAGPDTALPALSPQEAPAVVRSVNEHALKAGLRPEQAERLARAIVAELTPQGRPDGDTGADTSA